MGVSLYTVKQHHLPSNSITTSLRMKTAVLFSLVFLVLAIAFLNTASGCDCVAFVQHYKSLSAANAALKKHGFDEIPKKLAAKGIVAVCKGAESDLLAVIKRIPCDG